VQTTVFEEAEEKCDFSAKLEYLYHAYYVPTPNDPGLTNRAGGVPLYNNIVRAGLNYKIGWP
jgi:hypothetical protein